MKKYILNIVLVVLVLIVTLTSCSDFLDAENKSNQSADEYFKTEEGLEDLRVTAYSKFKSLVNSISMNEWGTDLYIPVRNKEANPLQTYNLTAETSDVSSYYSNLYSLINEANCCIYYGENNPQIMAESKFMRCYGYYLLMQHFGAVPYVDWYINDARRDYPRVSLSELYPTIIEELESIMNDASLPANSIETYGHSGYISQRAVKALLARVCLAAGWDLGTTLTNATTGAYSVNSTEYFSKAAQYAVEAINGQGLTMSFEDKWSPSNENNAEEIFSVQYDRAGYPGNVANGGHSLQNNYGSNYGEQATTGMKQVGSVYALSEKALYLWDEGDERWDGTFMNTLYNFISDKWGTTGYYAYYNVADKSNLNIAEIFYPWYCDTLTVEADLDAKKELLKRGDCVTGNTIQAYILGSSCVRYTIDALTGDWSDSNSKKETFAYTYACTQTNCPSPVRKFDDPNTTQNEDGSNDYRDIMVFHLSEMYLIAAEAYLLAGDENTALTYINAVRNRSNAGALNSLNGEDYFNNHVFYSVPSSFGSFTALDIILDESARELYAERTRWMDLRRTRQLVRYNVAFNINTSASNMSNLEGEYKWYRPIPATEIEGNESMTYADQNPGY